MYYVVAHDHYYPVGGFNDVKFAGNQWDCEQVKAELEKRYDRVYITDGWVSTTMSDWF